MLSKFTESEANKKTMGEEMNIKVNEATSVVASYGERGECELEVDGTLVLVRSSRMVAKVVLAERSASDLNGTTLHDAKSMTKAMLHPRDARNRYEPPPLSTRAATPKVSASSRGALFGELKQCRDRSSVARLEARLQPLRDAKEWNMLLTAHARAGNHQRAFAIPDEMRRAGVAPNVYTFNRLATACEKRKDWRRALSLLDEMRREGVAPDVYTFSAAISACEKGGQWQSALSLLDEMWREGVAPNVISYSAAISACEKGSQWRCALSLLDEMRREGVALEVITFSAVISACASAHQSAVALRVFEDAVRSVVPNMGIFNAVLDAVCVPQPAEARALWLRGVDRGVYADFEGWERGTPKLDLHGFSEGAAETTVRWWLEGHAHHLQKIIVTGWGKHRQVWQRGDLHRRVTRVLAAMGVPTRPTENPGVVLVDYRYGYGAAAASAPAALLS